MTTKNRCGFCGKPKGRVLDLVLARRNPSVACICDECLEVCRKILAKSGAGPVANAPAGAFYHLGTRVEALGCSFCGASQENVDHLIASGPGQATAFICDKCVD